MIERHISELNKGDSPSFRLPISGYTLGALGLIAFGIAIRVALLAQGWPHTNSDEGTYGMMAINIAIHGEHPIFMYGQNYMGTIQAYIAAGVFHLFGISMFNLRIGLVFLFALFLYAMYLLTSLLYNRSLALFSLLLLCLGSSYVLYRQVQAVGGWTETLFFGALLYFIACWLALPVKRNLPLRLAGYFGWGLLVGLCLWSDVVVGPFILMAGLLLLLFCRRELFTMSVLALLITGIALGALPMIIYNVHATLHNDSLLTAIGIFSGGTVHSSLLYQLVHGPLGVLLIGLPAVTGDGSVCGDVSQVLFLGGHGASALSCTLAQGTWSLVWIALWSASAYLSLQGIRALPLKSEARTPKQWSISFRANKREPVGTRFIASAPERCSHRADAMNRVPTGIREDEESQYTLVRFYARLGLLAAAAISLCLFALTSASTSSPFLSSRYILYIWIATPALIYPLWQGVNAARKSTGSTARFIFTNFKRLALLAIALLFLLGTVETFQEIPATQAANAQQADFINNLARIGAFHIYSDYWTCERVMFQSAGQITCYTVNESLNQGYERYLPNKAIVTGDTESSWAFPTNLPQAKAIAQRITLSGKPYHRYEFDGYVVYQPG